MLIELDEFESYAVPVSNINDVKFNANIIVLENELGEMWKCSQPCVIRFYKVPKLKNRTTRVMKRDIKRLKLTYFVI